MVRSDIATQIQTLNNEGANLIIGCHYCDAIEVLVKGLDMARNVLHDSMQDCWQQKTRHQQTEEDLPSCKAFPWVSQEHKDEHENGSFIFRIPFVTTLESTRHVSIKDYMILFSTLLFNLGLAHHLLAVNQTPTNLKKLNKAVSFYELAYAIQTSEGIEFSAIHMMAVMNNVGQISEITGDHCKAERLFGILLSTMMLLSDCGELKALGSMEGFIINVTPLILKKSIYASAA